MRCQEKNIQYSSQYFLYEMFEKYNKCPLILEDLGIDLKLLTGNGQGQAEE